MASERGSRSGEGRSAAKGADGAAPHGASVSIPDPVEIRSVGESEVLLRSLLDCLDLSVTVFDVRGGFPLYQNTGYERIFELPRQESQRHLREFMSRVHPDDREKVGGYLMRQFDGPTEQAYRYHAQDGSLRFIRGRTELIRAEDGRVLRMVGVARDVSEEHAARAALHSREERFRSVAEAIPGVVYLVPVCEQQPFLYLSDNVEDLTGLPAAFVRSRRGSLFERVHPDNREGVLDALNEIGKRKPMLVLYRLRHEDGSWRWVEQRGQGVWDEVGELQSIGGTIFDVTKRIADEEQRWALQARLFEAKKLESLGVMAGGLAHDFDNWMGLLTANVELARLRLDPESPARELLDVALEVIRQASGLTRQLLEFSGRGRRKIERVDLREVVRRTGGLLRRSAPQGVRIEFVLPENLPSIEVDRAQLEQLVTNLVRNACDAMGAEGGSIRVGCEEVARTEFEGDASERCGRAIVLFVEDDGAGMPAPERGRTPAILVVDDERIMRETACKVLGHYGYRTLQAANGREALEFVKTRGSGIGLVLLDLNMPGLSGYEVFPMLRRLRAQLPIVISSAYRGLESMRELEGADGVAFLPKPYGASELVRSVKRALL